MSLNQTRFENFHKNNPHVYTKLVDLARTTKKAGKTKYSIWTLFNILRWHSHFQTTGEPFKLCNNYTSRYARLIMENEPDLQGFFTTKALKNG